MKSEIRNLKERLEKAVPEEEHVLSREDIIVSFIKDMPMEIRNAILAEIQARVDRDKEREKQQSNTCKPS